MPVKVTKHWIKIVNSTGISHGEVAGKWIVFFKKNRVIRGWKRENTLKFHLRHLVHRRRLRELWLTSDEKSFAIVFTSADRDEIWRVKRVLMDELGISAEDLIWKADFETDEDWRVERGYLWFLSELLDTLHAKEQSIRQGRLPRALRIQEQAVDPLVILFRRRLLEGTMANRDSMVITPAFPAASYDIDPKLAFVLMPFREKWSDDVYHLIQKAAGAVGMKVQRADDIFEPGIIMNDIWKMINNAGLIVAEISAQNANVFYELGIAHTLGKKVVLLQRERSRPAPFDVAFWRQVRYGITPQKADAFAENLRSLFQVHLNEYEVSGNQGQ